MREDFGGTISIILVQIQLIEAFMAVTTLMPLPSLPPCSHRLASYARAAEENCKSVKEDGSRNLCAYSQMM